MMWATVLSLVILAVGIDYGSACSCAWASMQTHFCESDYVMTIRLRKVEPIYSKETPFHTMNLVGDGIDKAPQRRISEIKYHVNVNRIYKVKDNEAGLRQNSTVAILYSPPNDGMCGVHLDMRTKYVIGGQIDGPRIALNLCNLVQPLKLISKRQRKNMLSLYEDNCNCQTESYYPKLDTEMKCTLRGSRRMRDCYERNSACIINKNSITPECKWHRNKHLRACKAAARKPQLP